MARGIPHPSILEVPDLFSLLDSPRNRFYNSSAPRFLAKIWRGPRGSEEWQNLFLGESRGKKRSGTSRIEGRGIPRAIPRHDPSFLSEMRVFMHNYHMRTIKAAACIFFTPFLKTISLFSRWFFQKILSLCMTSIQEWFVIKSGL